MADVKIKRAAPWQPGQSGNPAGKKFGTRNKLQGNFIAVLAEDFDKHGKVAVMRMREEDPAAYVKCIATLMPKEFEIVRPLAGLSDEQLLAAIEAIKAFQAGESPVPIPEGAIPSDDPEVPKAADGSPLQ